MYSINAIKHGKVLEQELTTKNDSPKFCDRNICLKNEYNNVGCEDCEVTKSQESTTKNDLGKAEQETDYTWEDVSSVMDAMEYRTNSLIENIKSEIIHFANAHCSGDDINIYDVIKVIDDCCEDENLTTKNDLGVDCIDKSTECKHKCIDNDLGLGAVSREAVLDLIADYDLSMGQVVKGIHALPSVTPQEPKTGHWIPTYGNVECSVCGSVKDSRDVGKATHYCDFCGAKMVEPQESEET